MSELDVLQGLHRDLVALSELSPLNSERLLQELEVCIKDFQSLLDKPSRNETSRKRLATGTLEVSGEEYAINEEFQLGALQLADSLDLDEIEAARLYFKSQDDAEILGRSILEGSIIRFHQTRKYRLDCFRIILQQSIDVNIEEGLREVLQNAVGFVLQTTEAPENGPKYVRKCYQHMSEIRDWLRNLSEKVNTAGILGQAFSPEHVETIDYQRISLIQQHESLGAILHYLVKSHKSTVKDFEHALEVLRGLSKYDMLLVHQLPAVLAFISVYGAQDGMGSLREARLINDRLYGDKDKTPWALHYVYAAVSVWWLAEYSSWYLEHPSGSPLINVNLDEELKMRTKQFTDALKDGAFDFILSVAADIKPSEWFDPSRRDLREWLQLKAPPLASDSVVVSEPFRNIVVEQLESFIDAFITNMPDVLRKLRIEEDEQRQLSQTHEQDLDLEKFLVIIALTFEGRPDAAQVFWSDPDSNLAGFLTWASKRASTPLVSAFCEMLSALSEDEQCANAAHEFLLDEGSAASGKMRRNHSLTWAQIFKELSFFSSRLRDRPILQQSNFRRGSRQNADQSELEPEEDIMLQSYLRLITRLCSESTIVRDFVLNDPSQIVELLFRLASIPTSALFARRRSARLRSCAFTTLKSLLSHKTKDIGTYIWDCLEAWKTGAYMPQNSPQKSLAISSSSPIHDILEEIHTGFEEPNAFIQLLQALVAPYEEDGGLNDRLPFPELLGSSHRMPGIDPYVDFVGEVFGTKKSDFNDPVHARLLSLTCLEFILTCLTSFNENLVVLAKEANLSLDTVIRTSDLDTYLRLHPFSKIMPWLLSDQVMAALFETLHQDVADISSASPESPLVLSVLRAIQVMNLSINLQATYLGIVKPLVKQQLMQRRAPTTTAGFAQIEDGILKNIFIIGDLGLFCGTGHATLIIASLELLEKLSTSPKLSNPPGNNSNSDRNKVIVALESNYDVEIVARSLTNELRTMTELEEGPECEAYVVKTRTLDFLNACLGLSPLRPNVAHLLLGFHCGIDTVEISHNSAFARKASMFHCVLAIAVQYPMGVAEGSIDTWAVTYRYKACQLLETLWKSPLTSAITMVELSSCDFMVSLLARDIIVSLTTPIDGRIVEDPAFLVSNSSSIGLVAFTRYRASMLQYAASELRRLSREHIPSVKERLIAALQGNFLLIDGEQIQTPAVFDLFDFLNLDVSILDFNLSPKFFSELDLNASLETPGDTSSNYDIKRLDELTNLRRNELRTAGQLVNTLEQTSFETESQTLISYVQYRAQEQQLHAARLAGLDAWAQVVSMMVEVGGFEENRKTTFVLQALQIISPNLEKYSSDSLDESLRLAILAKLLVFNLKFSSEILHKGGMSDLANDRLLQLFRVCLRAIYTPVANSALREALYCICYRYITGISELSQGSPMQNRHVIYAMKSTGERLMTIVCDDAFAGEQTCRVAALLLLGTLVTVSGHDKTDYVVDSLVRLNFISLITDSLKSFVRDLTQGRLEDSDLLFMTIDSKLALLTNIAKTRQGATVVFDAGLFQAVSTSGLFATDPDASGGMLHDQITDIASNFSILIQTGAENPGTVKKFFEVLVAVMRVINTAVLSRGFENEQMIKCGRRFLTENRNSITSVFKRSVRNDRGDQDMLSESIEELAEAYLLLISLTGYLDVNGELNGLNETSTSFFT